jgi:hypothetical protein
MISRSCTSLYGFTVRLKVAEGLAYHLVEGGKGLMAKRDTEAVPFSGLQNDDANIFTHEDASSGFTEREQEGAISFKLHLLRFLRAKNWSCSERLSSAITCLPFRRAKNHSVHPQGSDPGSISAKSDSSVWWTGCGRSGRALSHEKQAPLFG